MDKILGASMTLITILLILYLFIGKSLNLLILCFGFANSRRRYGEHQLELASKLGPLKVLPNIAILVPAYNEEASIVESVGSMLRLDYPNLQVVVCNDGSKDRTLRRLIDGFGLVPSCERRPMELPNAPIRSVYRSPRFPALLVIDKTNGGKSDALNAAINFSEGPLICCVDADSVLDPAGLMQVALPFFEDPEGICGIGGVIRVANGSSIRHGRIERTGIPWNYLAMVQIPEYLRAFLVGRLGWDFLNINLIISGAFGLFRRDIVIKVGGFSVGMVGEDFELLIRMRSYCLEHKQNLQVRFFPNPVCWTEAPSDLRSLGNQRSRWTQGLAETLWMHRTLFFRPWSGGLGWVGLPYLLCYELLSAPVELIGSVWVLTGFLTHTLRSDLVGLFILVWVGFDWLLTLFTLVIEEFTFSRYPSPLDFLKLLLGSVLEQVGYKQLHLYWRVRGIFRWLWGNKHWGEITRRGFAEQKTV